MGAVGVTRFTWRVKNEPLPFFFNAVFVPIWNFFVCSLFIEKKGVCINVAADAHGEVHRTRFSSFFGRRKK